MLSSLPKEVTATLRASTFNRSFAYGEATDRRPVGPTERSLLRRRQLRPCRSTRKGAANGGDIWNGRAGRSVSSHALRACVHVVRPRRTPPWPPKAATRRLRRSRSLILSPRRGSCSFRSVCYIQEKIKDTKGPQGQRSLEPKYLQQFQVPVHHPC